MATTENSSGFMGDDRLKKSSGEAVRGSRGNADSNRENKDGLVLSAEERRAMLKTAWVHEILPTPPALPGFHTCWLSTNSQSDPIFRRQQIGYVPVKASEVPGFGNSMRIEGGEFDGCVAVNEMVLFKVPEQVYQDLMYIAHEERPAELEQAIYEKVVSADDRDSRGKPVLTVEGDFDRLRQGPREVSFT
jgi:hypothetical protein